MPKKRNLAIRRMVGCESALSLLEKNCELENSGMHVVNGGSDMRES